MIIYNDYKNEDWLQFNDNRKLPLGTIILINNQPYDLDVINHLSGLGYTPVYANKLCDKDKRWDERCQALDAENYYFDTAGEIPYSKALGEANRAVILYPENLGGEKYEKYDLFIEGCKPGMVILERTYQCWYPWDLKRWWDQNRYLWERGIILYMGIWVERIPWPLRLIQCLAAKWISGNRIFWYSEEKKLPVAWFW